MLVFRGSEVKYTSSCLVRLTKRNGYLCQSLSRAECTMTWIFFNFMKVLILCTHASVSTSILVFKHMGMSACTRAATYLTCFLVFE